MRPLFPLLFVLSVSCTESIAVDWPSTTDRSALLVVRAPGERPTVLALAVGERPPPLSITSDTEVVLLTYDGPLSAYGIEPGRVDIETAEDAGRPVPDSAVDYVWQPTERAWTQVATRPAVVDTILLDELDTCDAEGACLHFFRERLICGLPCPAISPIAPPPAVTPPMSWEHACADGFTANAGDRCRPAARVPCAAPDAQRLGDAQCGPLVTCPGTTWREDANPIGAVVYVDASVAAGGDGTSALPFDTIAAALAATTPPATLYLAAGDYAVPAIDGRVVLRGACPAQTSLLGAATIGPAADLTVQGVRLAIADVTVSGSLAIVDSIIDGPRLSTAAGGRLEVTDSRFLPRAGAVHNAGSATFEDVVFDASSAPVITSSGDLGLNGAVFASAPAVSVGAGVATVARAWVDADAPLAAFVVSGGALTVTDSALDVGGFAQVSGSGAVTATAVDVTQGALTTTVRDDARLTIERGVITTEARQALFAADDAGALTLDRVNAVGAREELVVAEGASDVTLADVVATDFDPLVDLYGTATLDLDRVDANGRVRAGASSATEVIRLPPGISNTCFDGFAPREGSRATITIDDFAVRGPLSSAIAPCAGTTATIRNVTVEDAAAGLVADCRGGCADDADVPDVDVDGIAVRGDGSSTVGVLIRGGRLTLGRAAISNVSLYGVYVWGAHGELTDLTVDGVGADVPTDPLARDVYCSENRGGGVLRAPASAFFTEAWSSDFALSEEETFLTRFAFSNSGCAAISMGVSGMFTANDGAITDNLRGLNFVRFGEPVIGEDVVFSGNRQADVYEVGLD